MAATEKDGVQIQSICQQEIIGNQLNKHGECERGTRFNDTPKTNSNIINIADPIHY